MKSKCGSSPWHEPILNPSRSKGRTGVQRSAKEETGQSLRWNSSRALSNISGCLELENSLSTFLEWMLRDSVCECHLKLLDQNQAEAEPLKQDSMQRTQSALTAE